MTPEQIQDLKDAGRYPGKSLRQGASAWDDLDPMEKQSWRERLKAERPKEEK